MSTLGPRPRNFPPQGPSAPNRRTIAFAAAVVAGFGGAAALTLAILLPAREASISAVVAIAAIAACAAVLTIDLRRSRAAEASFLSAATTFFENLPTGVLVLDERTNVVYANPALLRWYPDKTLATARGTSVLEFIHPADRERVAREMASRAAGEAGSYETRIQRGDGTVMTAAITAMPFVAAGDFDGALAVVTDVTDILDTRQRAQRYQELSAFALDVVTHDLSNRLQTVVSRAELLSVTIHVDDTRGKAAIASAQDAVLTVARLIKEVKQIAVAERESWPLRSIELVEFIDRTVALADLPAAVRFEAEVAPEAAVVTLKANDLAPLALSKLLEHASEGRLPGPGPYPLRLRATVAPAPEVVLRVVGPPRDVTAEELRLQLAPLGDQAARDTPWRSGVKLALAASVAQAQGWSLKVERDERSGAPAFEVRIRDVANPIGP